MPFETASYFNTTDKVINNIYVWTSLSNLIFVFPIFIIIDFIGPNFIFYQTIVTSAVCVIVRYVAFGVQDKVLGLKMYEYSQYIFVFPLIGSTTLSLIMISLWFPPKFRTLAQSINGVNGLLGFVAAMILGPIMITSNQATSNDFMVLTTVITILSVFANICCLIFLYLVNFNCLPQYNFPSNSSQEITIGFNNKFYGHGVLEKTKIFFLESRNIIAEAGRILTTDIRGFLCIVLEYMIMTSGGSLFVITSRQILCPYGYSRFVSTCGNSLCFLVSGLFFSSVASILTDKYGKGILIFKDLGLGQAELICFKF